MVQIEGLDKALSEHPFFHDMDPHAREVIAGCAANEVMQAGQYVFREGEPADKFYLIRHGQVAVELHAPGRSPIVLETMSAGETFGWSWMIEPYKWTFDVRALELTRLVSLDAKCLRGKLESDHELGYELFKRFIPVMANRLAATRLQLIDMYGNPSPKK